MKELRQHVEECYNEARRLQEMHSQLSSNYRCIAIKARMLRESLDSLDETKKRFGAIAETESVIGSTAVFSGYDFSEFDT